jgi:hypothetical protein
MEIVFDNFDDNLTGNIVTVLVVLADIYMVI